MRITLALSSAAFLAACATSQPAPTAPAAPAAVEVKATGVPGQAAAERTVKLTATITAIDAATRAVTIKDKDGQSETFKAPPEVKRFNELAVGDVIQVELTQGLLLEYQAAGTDAVEPHAVAVGGRAAASDAPGGAVAAGLQGTVTVVAIDLKPRLVTFQGPGGRQYQVKAGPQIQLEKLKVGDRLLATYVEAVAIQVVKGGQKL
jgi:Cu/Ag efflux protein CusF